MLKLVLFSNNSIKFEPTKPAPPVTTTIFFLIFSHVLVHKKIPTGI